VPRTIDDELRDAPRLDEAVSITVPVKPETLLTVIVDVLEPPGGIARLVGLAAISNLCGVTVTGTCTV
jgi:hypothetical protein